MKCRNCGKDIDEFEIFCDECKKELKSISSRKEVNELEDLIEEQKELNKLEETKVLDELTDLFEEKLNNEEEITVEDEPKTRVEKFQKEVVQEVKEEKKQKKNIKKIIILSSIVLLVIMVLIIVLLIFNRKEESKEEITIDYKKVINEYGKSIKKTITTYIEKKEELPTWQQVSELNKYKKYEVICETHNIYSDGSIYLNKCKINNKKTKYSYGKEKEEQKEGKELDIYKVNYNGEYYQYSDKEQSGSSLVGTITCMSDDCIYIKAFDKYVIVGEDSSYYLYDYENNSMEFGPFNMSKDYDLENLLVDNNTLYGIYYNEEGVNNIYSVNTGKVLKNLSGKLYDLGLYNSSSILYKYNYVILVDKEVNNFINLKTGNKSYSIKNIGNFIEDKKNKIVYITSYNDSDYSKFKIYNSNGKLLFDGKEFTSFSASGDNIIVSTKTEYKVYDSKLNLKLSSKKYDKVLSTHDDFIVVIEDKHLEIIDLNDKVLAKFDFEWDDNKYIYHNTLSGWYTENGKNGIYLVVEDKEIPFGISGSGFECYYIPSTSENGIIKTTGVGGYAKPILYLYPKEKTNITVTFNNPNLLTTTYPKFKNKWEVTAYPNGDLYDSDGNYYYALYWEEQKNHSVDFSEGFYVTKENAIEFLEDKLSVIGLNDKEKNEFIMYWLPILERNEKNLVYFELTNERDSYNKLIISPKPDSLLRVAIHIKKVNKKTSIKKQILTSFKRKGFTAVEWGGVIY